MPTTSSTPPGWQKILNGKEAGWVVAFFLYIAYGRMEQAYAAKDIALQKCNESRIADGIEDKNDFNRIIVDLSAYNLSPSQLRNRFIDDSIIRWQAQQYREGKDSL